MTRLCGRPGCSEVGAVACGMVPEDLVFWIASFEEAPTPGANVLCRRHADAMVVPLGWTLDDRRESALRLFRPPSAAAGPRARKRRSPRRRAANGDHETGEQLQIDGTDEIRRPTTVDEPAGFDHANSASAATPWEPEFDHDDDLDGLLAVRSPLLARAFRGTDRPKP